jgi:hypothetical protein
MLERLSHRRFIIEVLSKLNFPLKLIQFCEIQFNSKRQEMKRYSAHNLVPGKGQKIWRQANIHNHLMQKRLR